MRKKGPTPNSQIREEENMEITKLRTGKKARAGLVIAFLIIYALITYISLRGQYLEYLELGNQYVEKFLTDIKCKYTIMGISFVVLNLLIKNIPS